MIYFLVALMVFLGFIGSGSMMEHVEAFYYG